MESWLTAVVGPDRPRSHFVRPGSGGSSNEAEVVGAAGITGDLPLAAMYHCACTSRRADGPDEVAKIVIAKNVLKQYNSGDPRDFGH
jgi:hypothetical protein